MICFKDLNIQYDADLHMVLQVRVNALLCLGDMVAVLDKPSILEILQTIQRCTAVDRSAPTLMCTLGVASSILKKVSRLIPNLLFTLCICMYIEGRSFSS